MDSVGFVAAGYSLTALVVGTYVGSLLYRARKARARTAALAERRAG